MKDQSPDTRTMLDALQRAVDEALERKSRLGHYAVFWEHGKIIAQGEDAPIIHGRYPKASHRPSSWIEEDDD